MKIKFLNQENIVEIVSFSEVSQKYIDIVKDIIANDDLTNLYPNYVYNELHSGRCSLYISPKTIINDPYIPFSYSKEYLNIIVPATCSVNRIAIAEVIEYDKFIL
jgi:hypothetical protein